MVSMLPGYPIQYIMKTTHSPGISHVSIHKLKLTHYSVRQYTARLSYTIYNERDVWSSISLC